MSIPRLSENLLDSDMVTRRGFTDHEHLDEAELIHMNGRVYDYNVGRFMSVDPVIVDPGNSQAINPYSYVMNNPLGYTDPSGYTAEKTVKVSTTGSRIKHSVKVSAKSNGNGSSTVTISGGNAAARSAVKGAISSAVVAQGGSVADIGGQQETAVHANGSGNTNPNLGGKTSALTSEQASTVTNRANEDISSLNNLKSTLGGDTSTDEYARVANNYGYLPNEFLGAAKELITKIDATVELLQSIAANPNTHVRSYQTTSGTNMGYVNTKSKMIYLSSTNLGLSRNDSTIAHEAAHIVGMRHTDIKGKQYGGESNLRINVGRARFDRLHHRFNNNSTKADLDNQVMARSRLMNDNYNLVNTMRGVNYRDYEHKY